MHQPRASSSKRMPIPRKGTAYVAKHLGNPNNSVSVLAAVRDMLKLARTAKEVNEMIKQKLLSINGRTVKDYHESISLFNILTADKNYSLTFLPTGKFTFENTSSHERPCKVIGKRLVTDGKVQLSLHDGTSILSADKSVNMNDTLYISEKSKVAKHVSLEKAKHCFIIAGKFLGQKGTISSISDGKVEVKFAHIKDKTHALEKRSVIAL